MKIYTRKGDGGEADLIGGMRAPKSDMRFQAMGDLDELVSWLGMLKCAADIREERAFIGDIQREIMEISTHIAALGGHDAAKYGYTPGFDRELETRMDAHGAPALSAFALPGANEASARADVARTVARRAERSMVLAASEFDVSPAAVAAINRLSDYLFVLARTLEGGTHE